MLNIFWQGSLPLFLPVVCRASEFFGVESELTSHLDLDVGESILFAGLDPRPQLAGYEVLLGHFEGGCLLIPV